jgi:hypothetical protein
MRNVLGKLRRRLRMMFPAGMTAAERPPKGRIVPDDAWATRFDAPPTEEYAPSYDERRPRK